MKKIIFLIMDGMGDRPIKKFNNKTPLEAAYTPNMDFLAKNGITGIMHVLGKGVIPHSDQGHLTLFGYDLKKHYHSRGPIEALGVGLKLKKGDVALRANLGSVDKKLVVKDRRSGRIESTKPFVKLMNKTVIDGVKFILKSGTSHRAVIVMSGKGISDQISRSDPWEKGKKVLKIKALDNSKEAKFTADVLNKFLELSYNKFKDFKLNKERIREGKLAGNYWLARGAGHFKKIPSFKEMYNLKSCCIAGGGLYKGLGAIAGMEVLKVKGATGTPNTDLRAKFLAAKKYLRKYDFIFLHIKGTDIFGHDGNPDGKKQFIEKVDKQLPILMDQDVLITITADHSTPCANKDHSADPVPVLIYSKGLEPDSVDKFGESYCKNGKLGVISGRRFLKLIQKC